MIGFQISVVIQYHTIKIYYNFKGQSDKKLYTTFKKCYVDEMKLVE